VFAAGAGRIGEYERCSWATLGEGTFRGNDGTSPALGEAGRDETVTEYRVETVVPEARLAAVVEALRRAHPYEEPAFDVFPRIDV
jgi:structural toxin protein (hemagglutinin/hemolysin) RtxA